MNARALKILLLCGAFAATGVGVPFFLGPDPAYVSTINALHGLGVLGFFGGLFALMGIAGVSNSTGDVVYETPPSAPRILEKDVLAAAADTMPLESRIEAAAEASQRFGRTLGIIHYNVDAYKTVARNDTPQAAEAMMDGLIAALRPRLRNTDRVERLGKGRIAVVIVLLPEKAALESIRKRLDVALRAAEPRADGAVDVGMAIYPIGGYTGEDLLATAAGHAETERAARVRSEARQRRANAALDDEQAVRAATG
jgi:predicted signal transduction protein with EAL and GGDEF domain